MGTVAPLLPFPSLPPFPFRSLSFESYGLSRLGHKLYSASRQMRFADLQPANKAKRLLKPIEDIKQLIKCNATASEIYQPHWVLDIYRDRPDSLEGCSIV